MATKLSSKKPSFGQISLQKSLPTFFNKRGMTYNPSKISYNELSEMRYDPDIRAAMIVVKMPICNVQWWIEGKDRAVVAYVESSLKAIWGEFIRSTLRALEYGWAPHEKIWMQDSDGKIRYKKLLDLDPRYVCITVDSDTRKYSGLSQLKNTYEIPGENDIKIPGEKTFIFSNEVEFGNLYGESRMKAAYPFYFTGKWLLESAGMYFERFGTPILEGWAPDGQMQVGTNNGVPVYRDNSEVLLANLESLSSNGIIVRPFDEEGRWGFKFHEGSQKGPEFVNFFKWLGVMKQLGVFVPQLVYTQGQTGSYALGKEHTETFLMSLEGLLKDIKTHIDKFVIPQLVEYNFGASASPCSWRYKPLSKITREVMTKLLLQAENHKQKLRGGYGEDDGWRLDYNQMADDLGMPRVGVREGKITDPKAARGSKISESIEVGMSDLFQPEFRRNLFAREEKINFVEIEKQMDLAEIDFVREANSIIDKQISRILDQVSKALVAKTPLASLKNLRCGYIKDVELLLKKYMLDLFNLGKQEASKELKIKVDTTPNQVRNIIAGRARVIAQKHCNDMEHAAYLNVLENLHRTPKELMFALQRRLEQFKGAVS